MEQTTDNLPTKRQPGRPRKFTPRRVQRFLREKMAGKPNRGILEPDDMPHISTLYRELARNEELRSAYFEASAIGAEARLDCARQAVDDCPPETGPVQLARLKVDLAKFDAMNLMPKVYGGRVDPATLGNPPQLTVIINATNGDDRRTIDIRSEPNALEVPPGR